MPFQIAPFFHPTTVIFVDDNEGFLRSLDLDLPVNWSYRLFAQPTDAIDFLNRPSTLPPLVDRCFRTAVDCHGNRSITLDMSTIEQEINHLERFNRTSVVMIDYSMPLMSGLEFCAEIRDPYVQKAMLTGVADEKTAVQAFNARLIDRFVPKTTEHSVNDIYSTIEELLHDYFTQHTARLMNTLALDPPAFLLSHEVGRVLRRITNQHQIVEYYLVDQPQGFLMLRADGSSLRLLVSDRPHRAQALADAQAMQAPPYVLDALRNEQYILTYADNPRDYRHGDYPWEDNLVAATAVRGQGDWVIGIVQDPPADIDFDARRCSYNAFLKTVKKYR
ncbi:MAG: hypothetical protein R3E84_07405 [Pseudomonadales bacterium]